MVLWVRRPVLVGAVVVLLISAALTVLMAVRATGKDTTRCERFTTQSTARAADVTGHGRRVLVIGDSWSAGLGLARPDRSWPSRLDGRVRVDGFSGSGFSEHASPCAGVAFADRAPESVGAGAALVVVEGGLNDFDQPDAAIRIGFDRLLTALAGHPVVVVGPASAPSRAAQVVRVDTLLARLAAQHDVPYVRTSGLDLPYLPDRLHLTPAGHREFGDYVAAQLSARGLT